MSIPDQERRLCTNRDKCRPSAKPFPIWVRKHLLSKQRITFSYYHSKSGKSEKSGENLFRLLYITDFYPLPESGQFVSPGGNKLLSYISIIACLYYCLHDRRIVKFLCPINLIPPRNPTGMIMGYIRMILPNRRDDITFHDLHMINIIQ